MGGIAPPRRQAAAAAVGGYAPILIEEKDPVAAATITFLNIPQIYQNLYLELWLLTSTATARETLKWWVNNFTNVAGYYLQDKAVTAGVAANGHAGNNNAIAEVTGNGIECYSTIRIPHYQDPVIQGGSIFGIAESYWANSSVSISQLERLSWLAMPDAVERLDFFATGTLTGKVRLYGVP